MSRSWSEAFKCLIQREVLGVRRYAGFLSEGGFQREAHVRVELQAFVDLDIPVERVVPEEAHLLVDLAHLEDERLILGEQVRLLNPRQAVIVDAHLFAAEARLEVDAEPVPGRLQLQVGIDEKQRVPAVGGLDRGRPRLLRATPVSVATARAVAR